MNEKIPISFPHTIVAFAPIVAPFLIMVDLNSAFRLTALRGFITLVNTTLGPKKTSSSQITPSYTLTLFCIRTLSPKMTFGPIITFCPRIQFLPITAPGIT